MMSVSVNTLNDRFSDPPSHYRCPIYDDASSGYEVYESAESRYRLLLDASLRLSLNECDDCTMVWHS